MADLDGDGDLDVVCPGRSGLFWLENLRLGADPSIRPGPRTIPPVTYEDHSKLFVYKDPQGHKHPVQTPADWAIRRSHILANMQLAMGPLPDSSQRVPLDVQVLVEEETPQYIRRKITFVAEPGDRVPAWLLIPKNLKKPAPAMLCLHPTYRLAKDEVAGRGGRPTRQYGHELAARGYVCLVPDYPSFGEYSYDFRAHRDRYASGSMKAIWNNIRAVDVLESLPEVNWDRIGCIGHSLGGHNALFTAVFDLRIKAVITSCGFTAFHHYYGGNLNGWTSDRYMPRIRDVYQSDPDKVPFDFYEVLAAIAPRAIFVNAPLHDGNFDVEGVRKVIDRVRLVYRLLGGNGRLRVVYPDCAHDFPDEVRQKAYEWLDRMLKQR
ncbi:MAG: alpha/beta fold hydrolase [Planctomycetes bacterium]|nr:alpha/beta fold hydrolase [Planctomycetota bacterium]